MSPLAGPRFKCSVRNDFDLCIACESKDASGHPMLKIKKSADAPAAIICVQRADQPEAPDAAQPDATDAEAQTAEELLNRILQGDGDVTLADLVGVTGAGGCRPLRKALRQMLFRGRDGRGGRGPPHWAPRRCGPGGPGGPWAHAAAGGGPAPPPPPPSHWRPPWMGGPR